MPQSTLLTIIRKRLRISSQAFDDDIQMHIDAAIRRLKVTGINPDLLESGEVPDALLVDAITAYVRAHYAPDNPNADKYAQSFESFLQFLTLAGEYNGALE